MVEKFNESVATGGKKGETIVTDKITYIDVIKSLTNLKALAYPVADGESCKECSSYNKLSRYNEQIGCYENWDANDDNGLDTPRTPDGGYLVADLKGAGAIVRIWSAKPGIGHIKIFIDSDENPAIDMPFERLFGKGEFPFNLSALCYESAGGHNCYLPITYSKSCKIVLYDDWGEYYQFHYVTFGDNVEVEPFSLPLSLPERKALRSTVSILTSGEDFTKINYLSFKTDREVIVPAHGFAEAVEKPGCGAIVGIQAAIEGINGPGEDWDALSALSLSIYWDGESVPSVASSFGGFFGASAGFNPYSSITSGVSEDGVMYSNWYMPYEDGFKIVLNNDSDKSLNVSLRIFTVRLNREKAEKMLRFHVKQVKASDPPRNDSWPDSCFLQVKGPGRYVGTSLHVYKKYSNGDPQYHPEWWWGEGDEKFYIDEEKFPSWFGTGCEDYFGYGWGSPEVFSKPYHSQPFTNGGVFGAGNRLNNRFHITDNVPFLKSFRGTFEKYHRDGYCNWLFTNFWYMRKNTNDGYYALPYNTREECYEKPFPEPAEHYEGYKAVIIDVSDRLRVQTQDMSGFAGSWSGNSQLFFEANREGNLLKLRINIPESGKYTVRAAFTKGPDYGVVQHYIDRDKLGEAIDLYSESVENTGMVEIESDIYILKGYHELKVQVVGKNPQSKGYFYGLDYIKFV